jgi:hypothetical protein
VRCPLIIDRWSEQISTDRGKKGAHNLQGAGPARCAKLWQGRRGTLRVLFGTINGPQDPLQG